jgi:hypothetical protein
MGRKLVRAFRDRQLTPNEAAGDEEIRRKVQEEFPPKSTYLPEPSAQPIEATTSFTYRLRELAQSLVDQWHDFFRTKGPGTGDLDTNAFMKELRFRAVEALGGDYSEQPICGNNRLTPDFYFPEEATIVEIAMSLRNPSSEFERDILKAIMAQEAGNPVRRLVFLSKPGAIVRSSQPGLRAVADWAKRAHGISVEIYEFTPIAEAVLEPGAETSDG